MEKTESTTKLEMCESAEYDFTNSRFTAHKLRRSGLHCSKRAQIVMLVMFVFFMLITMGILMAMFGPGSTDLKYKTAKLEDKTTEPPITLKTQASSTTENGAGQNESTAASTQAPPVTCANTPGPTTAPVAPDVTCDVAIVGAGVAGLYVAKELTNKTNGTVCVFEKNPRLGGRIYDHHFAAAPNVSVGLGAWGLESTSQPYIGYTLLPELKIGTEHDWYDHLHLHRSRGITVAKGKADNLCDVLKAQVFPSLSQRKYTNKTCDDLIVKVTVDEKEKAADFTTAGTYLSNILTSEGVKLISEYYGVKSDYLHRIKPQGYIEYLLGRRDELDGGEFVRLTRGMSAFVKALKKLVVDQGGILYLNNSVSTINTQITQEGGTFHLQTAKHLVSASKVVLAVPPVALAKIKGDVTEKVTQNAIFKSILSVPAFKGAAVYKDAWWKNMLQPLKTFTSYDSCLGVTMPHEARGGNGESILYTAYANGACAEKWGVLEKQGPDALENAVQRALQEKFNNDTIPTPLKTQYKYWEDGAIHFQKAGSNYTETQVLSWATRPVAGQDVFLVGDAYYNYGYLCEHALKSAAKVLEDVWKIPRPSCMKDDTC